MTTRVTTAAMRRRRSFLPRALLLLALAAFRKQSLALSSIHDVHGKTTGCRFTERMFADRHGPFGIGGRSTVAVTATVRALRNGEVSDSISLHRLRDYFDFAVVVVSYADDAAHMDDAAERAICARNFSDPVAGNRDGVLYGEFHPIDSESELALATTFHPGASGLQVVLLVPCWKQKSESFGYPVSTTEFTTYPMTDPLLRMDATISFRNPHGYLPALLYGLFPFNGVLALLYGFVDVSFVLLINRYRSSAIGMQYSLLVVLLLATGESTAWFFTYKMLNTTGRPVCCPFPGLIIFSTLVKVLAGMVARVVTTLVCLGYGIVRPRISGPEIFVVSGLGLCYFVAVGSLEISQLVNQSDGDARPPAVWEFLAIVTNVCFGGWIFTSLALTRKNLAAFRQTAKLRMYTSLSRVLYAYVLVSFLLMATEGAVYSGTLVMDWQWIWLIWAANRVLMFAILVVVTIVWRPRPNSGLYAQMDQVPSQELDSPASSAFGIELTRRIPSAADSPMPLKDAARAPESL